MRAVGNMRNQYRNSQRHHYSYSTSGQPLQNQEVLYASAQEGGNLADRIQAIAGVNHSRINHIQAGSSIISNRDERLLNKNPLPDKVRCLEPQQ